jgi:hypothetical protein
MNIYIPTVFGDVNIHPGRDDKENVTEVQTTKLTNAEKESVTALLKHYKVDFDEKDLEDKTFNIGTNFAKVHGFLVKRLKAGKKTVTAAKLVDGSLVEVHDEDQLRKLAETGKAKSVTTTSTPARGCPMPRFEPREIRASRVLAEFLNPVQLQDFANYGAFVVFGGDSGHRFRIAHRFSRLFENPDERWFVKDLDTGRGYCSHITELPPSEETLALMVAIALKENWWLNERGCDDPVTGGPAIQPLMTREGPLRVEGCVAHYDTGGGFACTCGWRGSLEQTHHQLIGSRNEDGCQLDVWNTTCPRCGNGDIAPTLGPVADA